MTDAISSIKIRDLEIFLEVSRAKSIREVSRRLNLSPGKVSKSIQALEAKLGTKVYKRSATGVLPTAEGAEILEIANSMVHGVDKIKELLSGRGKSKIKKTLAVASTSFLNTHLTVPVTSRFAQKLEDHSFRFLDLAPDQLVPVGLRGGFEIAVHYGAIAWPSTWLSRKLGKSNWVLACRTGHPLSKKPNLKKILEYAFVAPVYWTNEGLKKGNDQFPVPSSKRKLGYETATADAAIAIIEQTNQLAFLPEILARQFVAKKTIRVIECSDLKEIDRELFISVRSDLVTETLFNGLADKISLEISS